MPEVLENIKKIFDKFSKKDSSDISDNIDEDDEPKKKLNKNAVFGLIFLMLAIMGISSWMQISKIKQQAIIDLEKKNKEILKITNIDYELFYVNNEEDYYLKGDFNLIRPKSKIFWDNEDFKNVHTGQNSSNFSKINDVLNNSFKELFNTIQ